MPVSQSPSMTNLSTLLVQNNSSASFEEDGSIHSTFAVDNTASASHKRTRPKKVRFHEAANESYSSHHLVEDIQQCWCTKNDYQEFKRAYIASVKALMRSETLQKKKSLKKSRSAQQQQDTFTSVMERLHTQLCRHDPQAVPSETDYDTLQTWFSQTNHQQLGLAQVSIRVWREDKKERRQRQYWCLQHQKREEFMACLAQQISAPPRQMALVLAHAAAGLPYPQLVHACGST